jgi:hypothetical protein
VSSCLFIQIVEFDLRAFARNSFRAVVSSSMFSVSTVASCKSLIQYSQTISHHKEGMIRCLSRSRRFSYNLILFSANAPTNACRLNKADSSPCTRLGITMSLGSAERQGFDAKGHKGSSSRLMTCCEVYILMNYTWQAGSVDTRIIF